MKSEGVNQTTPRKVVVQFHKLPNGLLELRSLTVLRREGEYESARGYDVDPSKTFGCYIFNESSAGCAWPVVVDGIYYASRGVQIKEEPNRLVNRAARRLNRTRRISRMPAKFRCDGGDALDWLERSGIQEHAVWCSDCRDHLPGDQLCGHCWWCDKIGWYSTPSERCKCADRAECEDGR